MNLEQIFKEETGFDAYANNDLRPKVPSDYYVEWLEEQLTIGAVGSCFCVEDTETSNIESIHLSEDKAMDEVAEWNNFKPSKNVRIVERELT